MRMCEVKELSVAVITSLYSGCEVTSSLSNYSIKDVETQSDS